MNNELMRVFSVAFVKKNYLENLMFRAFDAEFEAKCQNDMDEVDRIVERYRAGEINKQCAEYLINKVGEE